MRNPFQYGSVVTGDAFCNREQELQDVTRAMENCEKLFIYSERRYGKTSLVKRALAQLPQKKYLTAYIDLWPTDGETSFIAVTAKAITQAAATTTDNMLEIAKSFFGMFVPTITLNNEGKPQVEFGVKSKESVLPEIEEVLAAPAKIAAKGKRRAVVIFDECQQIMEYESDLVERQLRSCIQHQEDVSYIFLGSRKHLVQRMFLEKSRPLYRSAGHYPLPPIKEEAWLPFVQERFSQADKTIREALVRALCDQTQGHPFYTQHLCHTLWELTEPGTEVTEELLAQAVDLLLDRESYAYTTMWDSLTKNPQRFLKGLAKEPPGVKPFSSEFTARYGLGSASNAQRAVETLLDRDLIDPDNGSYVIVDRFFRIWIQRFSA